MKSLPMGALRPFLSLCLVYCFLVFNQSHISAQNSSNHQPNIVLAVGVKTPSNIWSVGSIVPNATIMDVNGKKYQLYDLLDKPVVIEFFNVKSAQSKKNKGYLKSFYTKFNINILSVTPANYPNQVRKTAQDMNLRWPQVLDDAKKFDQASFFNSGGIEQPRFIIITPDKRVKKVFYNERDIAKVGGTLQQHFR